MSKRNPSVKKKVKIDWESFQNDKPLFITVRKILKIVTKYEGIGIASLVSENRADGLLKDKMSLAALNVFLAVEAGRAEGAFIRANGLRKSKYAEFFIKIKEEAENEGSKITDSTTANKAEMKCKKFRIREAKAQELSLILSNVMFRANKLVDSLETAIQSLEAERRRTE